MKKYLKGIFTACAFCSVFLITSCHNMCADLEKTIGAVSWIDKLEWVDVFNKVDPGVKNSNFTVDSNHIINATGSGNWMFSNLGRDVKGYEAEVKLSSGSYAGIQLFATDSYAQYVVLIRSNKSVEVYYDAGKTGSTHEYIIRKPNAVSDPSSYNSVKLEIQKGRRSNVYINGQYICTIPDHNLHYGAVAVWSGGSGSFKLNRLQH